MPLNKGTLNSIIAVLLQEWLSHKVAYEGWYAIKQRNLKYYHSKDDFCIK